MKKYLIGVIYVSGFDKEINEKKIKILKNKYCSVKIYIANWGSHDDYYPTLIDVLC